MTNATQTTTSDFNQEGTVRSSATQLTIEGIEVRSTLISQESYTDENGHFQLLVPLYYPQALTVNFADVDGAANGNFQDSAATIDISSADFENSFDTQTPTTKTIDTELDPAT